MTSTTSPLAPSAARHRTTKTTSSTTTSTRHRPAPHGLATACIFDFDGTLFDTAPWLPPRGTTALAAWLKFHSDAEAARPIQWVHDAAYAEAAAGRVPIIVTAREERYRDVTERMLSRTTLPIAEIVMKTTGDTRPDDVVKSEMLDRVQRRYDVHCAHDDRPSVLRLWRSRGLATVAVPGWPADLPD